MPCMPSLFQPGRRGGGRRWRSALAKTRTRPRARRDTLPKEPITPQRQHAWEPQPQVLHRLRTANAEATVAFGRAHQDVTGATSGTAVRRLCPILEGKEVVKGSFSAAAAARAFIAWACRRAPPAVPAETPSTSTQRRQRRDRKGGAGREGVGKVVQGRMGNEDDQQGVAETSRASSVALPSIFQAFGADPAAVPVGAPTVSVERGCDRDGKEQENKEEEAGKHELVSTERVGKDNERCKVAEVKVAAGATTTALPSIFQAFSAVPPPVAAPEASISSIQRRHERDREGEDDQEEKEEEEVVGAERIEDAEEQEEAAEMEAPSAGAAAAHASIAHAFPSVDSAAAAVAGTSSTNIERGSQEGGEREEDQQQEEGEEKLGKSPVDTFLASLGYNHEIYGSPVPADFRPKDHEDDILCNWSFDFFDKKAGATLLGSGAFGSVYRVWTKTGKQMAVKVINTADETEERWADLEVNILRGCSVHPAIVGLHGFIRTPTQVHMLMPEAPFSLRHVVKHARLSEEQAGHVARKLMSALEFVHGRNIIHRDIKPGNVLVRESEVYLADFGLAVRAPTEIPSRENACGTLQYMAPEFFEGQAYGAGVDVWALGVVLYEMLHGKLPFTDQPDVQSKKGGGGGSVVGRVGGSGNVSESSGSIVTGCSESQEHIKWNIVKGNYEVDESLIGDSCRDLISQLLSRDPRERLTAIQASGHPWFGKKSAAQRRRRTARLAVATNTAERAMSDAQRLQALVQPSSVVGCAAAAAVAGSSAVVQATTAATSAVAELGQMVVMLSQVVDMGKEVKGWERKASAKGAKEDDEAVQTAVGKAEEIVLTVEMFAGQAETAIAEATTAVDSWEKLVREQARP